MEWRDLQTSCNHCGAGLEGRPKTPTTMVIQGWEPMEYRHITSKSPSCTVTYQAQPYTDCGQYNQWLSATGAQP